VNVYTLTENQFFTLLRQPKMPGVSFSTDQEPLATWTLDTSQATPNEAHLFKTRVPPDGKLEPGLYILDVAGINTLEDGSTKEVSGDWRFVIVSPYNVLLKVGALRRGNRCRWPGAPHICYPTRGVGYRLGAGSG